MGLGENYNGIVFCFPDRTVSSLSYANVLRYPIEKHYPRSIPITGHEGRTILSPMITVGST